MTGRHDDPLADLDDDDRKAVLLLHRTALHPFSSLDRNLDFPFNVTKNNPFARSQSVGMAFWRSGSLFSSSSSSATTKDDTIAQETVR